MHLPTISLILLPLLAIAQDTTSSTTTLTSTATMTKTITISQVVASVTSTYGTGNTTSAGPTAISVGTTSTFVLPTTSGGTPAATTSTIPENFMGAASSINSGYAGGVALVAMLAAALL